MQNPSPALAWKDAPAGTKSFVLIMHDPDAPMARRVHALGALRHSGVDDAAAGGLPGRIGRRVGQQRIPSCGLRRSVPADRRSPLSLHALRAGRRVPLGLQAGATKADVEKAMQGHVLGSADLVGLYQRQPK